MQQSPFPSAPIAGSRTTLPEMDMVVDLFIHKGSEICILHDRPFAKTVSWLEYDQNTNRVDFIMEDGDIRNFGIPVDPQHRKYFHNTSVASMVLWNPKTRQAQSGVDLPLIIHAN